MIITLVGLVPYVLVLKLDLTWRFLSIKYSDIGDGTIIPYQEIFIY